MIKPLKLLTGALLLTVLAGHASATTIGTGQTVNDTSEVGQNINLDGTLTNSNSGTSGNIDTGAALLNLSGDFTDGLGTGANQVQWTGSGGFYLSPTSFANPYNINIGGQATPLTLTWGQGGFVPLGSALVLDGSFTFENNLNLGSDPTATRQIDAQNGGVQSAGSSLASISGMGGLLLQGYGLNSTNQFHGINFEGAVSITGSLNISNTTVYAGLAGQTSYLISAAGINVTNGGLFGDVGVSGGMLQPGTNVTLSSGGSFDLGGSPINRFGLATQTLGQLKSTDATTQIYLGVASGNGTTFTVSPAILTVNSGYFAGEIADGNAFVTKPLTDPGAGGSIIKTGTDIFTLAGNSNTYVAGTTVQQGTLLVTNTSGSATGTGAVTVMSGGSLGGTGIIAPTGTNNVVVQSGGKVDLSAFDPSYAPASLTNTLTLHLASTNTATFQTGSSFVFDLGPAGASSELAFTGLTQNVSQVVFNNNQVSLNILSGAADGTYTLFSFDQSGAYSGILQNGTNYTFEYDSNDIQVVVTPEPSSWSLVLFSLLCLLSARAVPRRSNCQIKNGMKIA